MMSDEVPARSGRPGGRHIGEASHEAAPLVECRPVFVGPGKEALERGENEARIDPAQRVPAAAQPFHGAGRVVFDHDIGAGGQPMDDLPAAVRLEIDGERALVAVEAAEEAGGEARQAARLVAVRRGFDLDDVCAEIGEHEAAARPHDRLAELQHPDAGERERGVFGHRSRNLCLGNRSADYGPFAPRPRRGHLSVGEGREAAAVTDIHSWREWISFIRTVDLGCVPVSTVLGTATALLSGRVAGAMLRYPFRKSRPFPMIAYACDSPCA